MPAAVRFIQYETVNWGSLAAAAVIMAVPVVIVTLSMQRQLVSGLAMGSVKGCSPVRPDPKDIL